MVELGDQCIPVSAVPGLEPHFYVDPFKVELHGALADSQQHCDFFVGQSAGHHVADFRLAFTQNEHVQRVRQNPRSCKENEVAAMETGELR